MGILLSVLRYLGNLIDDVENQKPENPLFFRSYKIPNTSDQKMDRSRIVECSTYKYSPPESVNGKVKSPSVQSHENKPATRKRRRIKHYNDGHRILLVGEGDFSFSTCLARAFGCAANMIATSLNSEDFLVKNYEDALPNIVELGIRNCKVMHEIDATVMVSHEFLGGMKFDRIIFNFPFAGFFNNLSEDAKLRRHRRLVSLFLKNAKEMLSENGEIHISHKTNGVHAEWKLESMASSHGLMLIEAVDFKLCHYPGYNTKRGFGGDDNFHCYPSKTYKFGLKCS